MVLEPGRDGSAVLDTWELKFQFAFDCYITYPSRGYILVLDSVLVGEPQYYMYVPQFLREILVLIK